MIRMIQSRSAEHAKKYFSDALSKSDYYASDQELAGFWQGRLGERIGLTGETTKKQFFALCENLNPVTGGNLTPRTDAGRTVGYDINFHCPKSVSVLHAFMEDGHILDAFQDSVTQTMRLIEDDAQTRVRIGGKVEDRATQELLWGHFTHQTARPVKGAMPDPHLHSHCFVLNATWDDTEGRIKAGKFKDIKRDMPFYQAYFHKDLSDRLTDLGYGIRRTDTSFEITGVPQKVINMFCKRTDEIGRVAKEKGITSAKELNDLGARTRSEKQKGHSMEELKDAWREQILSLGTDDGDYRTVRFGNDERLRMEPQQCVDHAVLHSFERASVVPARGLLAAAYRHSLGSNATTTDIKHCFEKDKRLMNLEENGRRMSTTKEVLNEEREMVAFARQGKGAVLPLYDTAPEVSLDGQQGRAVAHVLTTRNRISIIRGAAGTGKTTLMKEAVAKIEDLGKQVVVVAPTAQASRGTLKEEGFENAETVAKLLTDKSMQERLKDNVLWVDEAGLLGTKDMLGILKLTQHSNARLILGGDTRQHASIVRGDALRILNTVAGIKAAEVSKIYRQKDEDYKDAVHHLSKGDVGSGFKKLDELEFIKEIDPMNPHEKLVSDYIEAVKSGKTVALVCPTHAEGEKIAGAIRARLKAEGMVFPDERAVKQYKNISMTEAEKMDIRNYREGQFVQFNQNLPNIMRRSIWEVWQGENGLQLMNDKKEIRDIPLQRAKDFDLMVQRDMEVAAGDKLLITRNSILENKQRLNNGDAFVVDRINDKGEFMLKAEKGDKVVVTDLSFGHAANGYVLTSYAAQGKSVDEVFIYQPSATFDATDAKQFYVSVSRGKWKAHLYTDNKVELLEYAMDARERLSALELMRPAWMQKDYMERTQWQDKQLTQDFNHTKDGPDHEL